MLDLLHDSGKLNAFTVSPEAYALQVLFKHGIPLLCIIATSMIEFNVDHKL